MRLRSGCGLWFGGLINQGASEAYDPATGFDAPLAFVAGKRLSYAREHRLSRVCLGRGMVGGSWGGHSGTNIDVANVSPTGAAWGRV